MHSALLTLLFAAALLASLVVKFWLATRQMRHVAAHRDAVPAAFAAHRHARGAPEGRRLHARQGAASACSSMAFGAAVLLGWTLLGGLDALNAALRDAVQPRFGDMAYQLALLAAFALIGGLLELPFELYSTFRIEQRFGFNRMTWRLYLADMRQGRCCVGALIGLPIAALILWIMGAAGGLWWLWAWGAWMALQPADAGAVPDRHRAAVQQVRAAATTSR